MVSTVFGRRYSANKKKCEIGARGALWPLFCTNFYRKVWQCIMIIVGALTVRKRRKRRFIFLVIVQLLQRCGGITWDKPLFEDLSDLKSVSLKSFLLFLISPKWFMITDRVWANLFLVLQLILLFKCVPFPYNHNQT